MNILDIEREVLKNLSSTLLDILNDLKVKPFYVQNEKIQNGIFELLKKKEKEEYMIEILSVMYKHTPDFYDYFLSIYDSEQNTLLIKACIERKQQLVKYILNTWKIMPNHKNSDGLNAFIYCCRNKFEDEAMMILDKGETDILTIDPLLHCTPIMYACSHRMRNLVRRILTMGPCNLGVPSKTGVTPIMVACLNGLFEECVVMYASGEANISNVCKQNNTLFNTACNMGFEELAFKMLNEHSIKELNAELVHKDGTNALHNALHHRMWGVSVLLIHKNYDLMIPLKDGDNPLIVASFKGLEDIAMEIAMRRPELISTKNNDNCTPLIMACDKKCVKLAHYLLEHGDCLISSEDNCNETALMIACKNELSTVVLRILEIQDESHTLVNKYHESALYWAIKMNMKEIYLKLISLYSFHSSNTHDKKILELFLQMKDYACQRIVLEKMTIQYLESKFDTTRTAIIPLGNSGTNSVLIVNDVEDPISKLENTLKTEESPIQIKNEESKSMKNKKKKNKTTKTVLSSVDKKEEPTAILKEENKTQVMDNSSSIELSNKLELNLPKPTIEESNEVKEDKILPIIVEPPQEMKKIDLSPNSSVKKKERVNTIIYSRETDENGVKLYVPPKMEIKKLNSSATPFKPRSVLQRAKEEVKNVSTPPPSPLPEVKKEEVKNLSKPIPLSKVKKEEVKVVLTPPPPPLPEVKKEEVKIVSTPPPSPLSEVKKEEVRNVLKPIPVPEVKKEEVNVVLTPPPSPLPEVKVESKPVHEVKINHLPPLAPRVRILKREDNPSPPKKVKEPVSIQKQNEEILKQAYLPPSSERVEELRTKAYQHRYYHRMNYTNIQYWYQEVFMKMYRTSVPSYLFNDISYIQYRVSPMDNENIWYKIEYFDLRDLTHLYVFQYIV